MRMRRVVRLTLVAVAGVLAFGAAGPARGALLWTLTASPLTVSAGTPTTFSLRASLALLGDIRCVEVGVPDNFIVTGAAVVGSNAGNSWTNRVVGNDVWVYVTSGGDRLRSIGHFVDFTITATAWSTGSLAWGSHSHDQEDCGGAESLLSVPPIVLVVGPAVTPTPAPTVAPTPVPTPKPTVLPVPLPTLAPIPLPTPRPSASIGLPPLPGDTSRPTATRSAEPVPTPEARTSPGVDAPSQPPGASSSAFTPRPSVSDAENAGPLPPLPPPGGGAGTLIQGGISADPGASSDGGGSGAMPLALGALGLLGSIDIWIVPGLLLGVPGLLVVAFVLLQAVGVLAWIPAIRRLRGDPEPAAF
jgi:hypothetical protein